MKNKKLTIGITLICILFFLLIYDYGYKGISSLRSELTDEIDLKLRTIEKFNSLIQKRDFYKKELTEIKVSSKKINKIVIKAKTPALAAANIQNTIKSIVTGKGGTITKTRVRNTDDIPPFKIINVEVDATIPDIQSLTNTIYEIEGKEKGLILKGFDTRVKNHRRPGKLSVKLHIAALTR